MSQQTTTTTTHLGDESISFAATGAALFANLRRAQASTKVWSDETSHQIDVLEQQHAGRAVARRLLHALKRLSQTRFAFATHRFASVRIGRTLSMFRNNRNDVPDIDAENDARVDDVQPRAKATRYLPRQQTLAAASRPNRAKTSFTDIRPRTQQLARAAARRAAARRPSRQSARRARCAARRDR